MGAGGGIKINNTSIIGGADGKTPVFKIEDGKLYNSYDNGTTWYELGQVQGPQGPQGPQGENGENGLTTEEKEKVDKLVIDGTGDKFLADNGEYKKVGGGSSLDVQIDGTSIVQDGVANIPIATQNKAGLVRAYSDYGTIVNANGILSCDIKKLAEYNRGSVAIFISKGTLENIKNNFVKQGITANTIGLTDDEKASAQAWLGVDNKLDKLENNTVNYKIYSEKPNNSGEYLLTASYNPIPGDIPIMGGAGSTGTTVVSGTFAVATPQHPYAAANMKFVEDKIAKVKLYQHNIQVFVQHSDTDENAFGFEFVLFNTQSTAFGKDELFVYLNKMSGIPVFVNRKYWISKEDEFLADIRYYSGSGFETENGYITWNDEYSVVADIVIDM